MISREVNMIFTITAPNRAAVDKAIKFLTDQFEELDHRCGWGEDAAEDLELQQSSIKFDAPQLREARHV